MYSALSLYSSSRKARRKRCTRQVRKKKRADKNKRRKRDMRRILPRAHHEREPPASLRSMPQPSAAEFHPGNSALRGRYKREAPQQMAHRPSRTARPGSLRQGTQDRRHDAKGRNASKRPHRSKPPARCRRYERRRGRLRQKSGPLKQQPTAEGQKSCREDHIGAEEPPDKPQHNRSLDQERCAQEHYDRFPQFRF